jgi:hypothetical protein
MAGIVAQLHGAANRQDQRSSDEYALKRLMVKPEWADANKAPLIKWAISTERYF